MLPKNGTRCHAPVSTRVSEFGQTVGGMRNESCWSGSVAVNELGDRLSALRLMSEPAQRAIEASLVRYGQLSPVICAREATEVSVVDGFKRLRAAVRLGWSELQVMVHESPDVGASQLLMWQSNEGNGLTDLEQAWLVRSLLPRGKTDSAADCAPVCSAQELGEPASDAGGRTVGSGGGSTPARAFVFDAGAGGCAVAARQPRGWSESDDAAWAEHSPSGQAGR